MRGLTRAWDHLESARAWFGFGSESPNPERPYDARSASHPSHLWAVFPDSQVPPRQVSVVVPTNFDDSQALAECFKRQQPVILNLQQADSELSKRMVDFCAGLTYGLDGRIQTVGDRLFLLTPHDVEVWAEGSGLPAEQKFFNQL